MNADNHLLYWKFSGKQCAERKSDWKVVIIKKDTPLELYIYKEDMTEPVNLTDKYPEMVIAFEKEMKKHVYLLLTGCYLVSSDFS